MTKNNCQELLLTSLNDFYNKNYEFKILFQKIINGNHKLSLRLIDWLVTHYSKNFNVIYWIHNSNLFNNLPDDDKSYYKKINLYLEYRAQLKSYAKLYFDTFRRHERITFYINDNEFIETTIGQLNFFRWVFNNNIITYALNNYENIYNNMIANNNFKKNNIKISNYQEISKFKSRLRFD